MLYHNRWETKGTHFGDCFTADDAEFMYVHIPKNASSWTRKRAIDLGWSLQNYHQSNLQNKHAIIVLRDPLERWLSGIVEYFYRYHKNTILEQINDTTFDILADVGSVDAHTEQQVYYIEGLNYKNCTFFYCDANYSHELTSFLNCHNYNVDYSNSNFVYSSKDNYEKQLLLSMFSQMLENPKHIKHLKGHFSKDYQLLDQITFYKSHDQI